jgi:hypothetical protein
MSSLSWSSSSSRSLMRCNKSVFSSSASALELKLVAQECEERRSGAQRSNVWPR